MSTKAIRGVLSKLDGPGHHDRDALLARNGRWGTCGACPRGEGGHVEPERCEYTSRSDHNIKRPNHDAWAEVEAIERAAKDLTRLHLGDRVYDVRDTAKVRDETPTDGTTWNHPDVKAWSVASVLLESIAEEAP